MGITPGMRTITPGETAVAISGNDGPPDGGRDDGGAPTDVERLRAAGHHHPHHRGIAGQAPCRGQRHRAHVIQLARTAGSALACDPTAGGCLQGLGRHREREMRSLSGHGRTPSHIQPVPADLSQGIRTSLGGGSVIFFPRASLRIDHRPQGREQGLSRLWVKIPVHPHHALP